MPATTPSPMKHPAPYSEPILVVLEALILAEQKRLGRPVRVLDPLAGVGRIHRLAREGRVETYGIEVEEEWAHAHASTVCADSIAWMETGPSYALWYVDEDPVQQFDIVCSSPPYGNRFSDSHVAMDVSIRRSYTHDLRAMTGDCSRTLHPNNSGSMVWGHRYWEWCARLYRALPNVLAPEGLLLWNVSDFVRGKGLVPAVTFHRGALYGAGFQEDKPPRLVETARLGFGDNREARAPSETILRMRVGT